MTLEATRALLKASGYQVRFREHEWVECLLVLESGPESWVGRGRDRASALAQALRRACPSKLAADLLARAVQEAARTLAAAEAGRELGERGSFVGEARVEVDAEIGPSLASADVSLADLETDAAAADEAELVEARIDVRADEIATTEGESAEEALPVSSPPALRQVHPRPTLVRPTSGPPPLVRRDAAVLRFDPPHALEELDTLMDRIRDSREELGLCSPERQRLAMLAWICEARAHTDTFPEDLRIRERVGVISRQLTEIGKTFWPGSVTALQLQMQPRDLPRHVLGGPAATWVRAAELAERALRSLEYTDERRGFDAYGWADARETQPSPPEASKLLADLIAEVERYGGSLAYNAVPRDPTLRPEPEEFRRWVRLFRWLRGADVDPDRWARLGGRLRWWSNHRDAPFSTVARELDAQYAPEQPWAKELGMEVLPLPAGPVDGRDARDGLAALRRLPQPLLESIRAAMSGKRIVFVSNRRDPDLQMRLMDALPSATLDWRVAEPKRLEALGEAIQQGAYDVVLGALGFQSQGIDHLLARACRQANVRYVRVNRGRPLACLRAIARDLDGAA